MTLDVAVPTPPAIEARPVEPDPDEAAGDGRRDAIADVLAEGAWAEGFEAWADDTHLTAGEFAVLRDHDLLAGLDFYWDPESQSVRYEVPAIPATAADELHSEGTEEVRAALEALAREVAGVVESDYLVREEGVFEFSSGDTDPEFRDTE